MLSHLTNVVASGAKTSGFKKSHLNACVKAINEKFNSMFTGDQVKNHLKTWSRKFQKYKLKNISGVGSDEDILIITLAEDHYNNYVATHKADPLYLNKPLEHYGEMQTIFRNKSVDIENEDLHEIDFSDATVFLNDHGATSASKPKSKRAKTVDSEGGMLAVFKNIGDNIAKAIEKLVLPPSPTNNLPDDLFKMVQSILGFQATHYDLYLPFAS
ncbi:hypothetical protein U9M48_032195 [Paspalum notatum var. saurae]|uniref:Myb/SANT-like domain-containing protein n=1 Tax=Paspalum notatum var. saurae TaxID=547442 RepID=A0AAQ3U4J5_PASNO